MLVKGALDLYVYIESSSAILNYLFILHVT